MQILDECGRHAHSILRHGAGMLSDRYATLLTMANRPWLERAKSFFRGDSFASSLTGLNTYRDKRTHAYAEAPVFSKEELEIMYRGSDLGGVLVEALPDELMREGWKIKIEGEKELESDVNAFVDGLNFNPRLKEALNWSRIYGGANILVGADDGQQDLMQPLNYDAIKTIRFFNTFQRYETYPLYYYGDPMGPNYGFPSIYYLQQLFGLPQEAVDVSGNSRAGVPIPISNSEIGEAMNGPQFGASKAGMLNRLPSGFVSAAQPLRVIHSSRFLLVDGIPVTRVQRVRNNGFGDSVFVRVHEVLRDYHMSWAGVCNLLQDFAQGVFKLQGLNDMMVADNNGAVVARAQLIDMTRGIARAAVLDAGGDGREPESFERVTTALTGLPEIMQQLALRLAAAARMPVSLLLGQAPAGLNATGDSDIRWYYDRIKTKQNEILKPILEQLMRIVFATKDGPTKGQEPENWSIYFNPLWQLDSKDEAQRRLFVAQSDQIYMSTGAVTPSEVGTSRFADDEYNGDTITIDVDAREAMGQPEAELEAMAAGTEASTQGAKGAAMDAQGKNPDGTQKAPEPSDQMSAKSEKQKAAEDTSPRTNTSKSV